MRPLGNLRNGPPLRTITRVAGNFGPSQIKCSKARPGRRTTCPFTPVAMHTMPIQILLKARPRLTAGQKRGLSVHYTQGVCCISMPRATTLADRSKRERVAILLPRVGPFAGGPYKRLFSRRGHRWFLPDFEIPCLRGSTLAYPRGTGV